MAAVMIPRNCAIGLAAGAELVKIMKISMMSSGPEKP